MTILLLRNLLIASAVAATPAAASTLRPPQAHELDEYYTFAQYLDHHPNKSYSDPAEYYRRKQIFEKNLKMILAHNEGKIHPSGELTDGSWVMGINKFTDQDPSELPLGYNKALHNDWSSQMTSPSNVLATERRRLGGLESYEVRALFLSVVATFVLLVMCLVHSILTHSMSPLSLTHLLQPFPASTQL
jgi:hypothetical protein